jgi:hypothetical protein
LAVNFCNNLLALKFISDQIIELMTRSLRFYLLIVFLSLSATSTSFGQTELPDEVNDLMYDSSKEYQKGDTVWDILDENGTLFTALQTVDPGIAPIGADGKRANQEYWSTGEEYTDAVAKENSDDLDNVPDVVVDDTQVPNEDIPDLNGSDVVFARLVNLSSRAYIDGNDPAKRTLIASFIIEGNEKKSMLVRGISHSMGIDDPLPNPSIYVNKTVNGVLDENFISNNDWEDDSALVSSLKNHRPDLLPSSSLESALILKDLDAGAYSVVLSGVSPSGESVTGVALIDAYEWNI